MIENLLMSDGLLTVGQVAEGLGVTVRTLHHDDEIGLVVPSERSRTGYRLYTEEDLRQLQHVVYYRRLGLPLEASARCTSPTRASRRPTRTSPPGWRSTSAMPCANAARG